MYDITSIKVLEKHLNCIFYLKETMRTRGERRMLSRIKFIAKIKRVFNEYGKFQAETWDQFKKLKWVKLYKNTRTWQKKCVFEKLDAIHDHKQEKRNANKQLKQDLIEYESIRSE